MDDSIGRKRLPHQVPDFIVPGPEGDTFFVTINTLPRGLNQLAKDSIWTSIEETFLLRETRGELHVRLLLAMPDHLHAILAFPGDRRMPALLKNIKAWLARSQGLRWQRDFFDHRLRSHESAAEKGRYIRMNPVRAGLIENPDQWPFVLDRIR